MSRMHQRVADLEGESPDRRPAPLASVMLVGIEPQIDEMGNKRGPGRVVSRIELKPIGAKP